MNNLSQISNQELIQELKVGRKTKNLYQETKSVLGVEMKQMEE